MNRSYASAATAKLTPGNLRHSLVVADWEDEPIRALGND